jgi:hypothetical protein
MGNIGAKEYIPDELIIETIFKGPKEYFKLLHHLALTSMKLAILIRVNKEQIADHFKELKYTYLYPDTRCWQLPNNVIHGKVHFREKYIGNYKTQHYINYRFGLKNGIWIKDLILTHNDSSGLRKGNAIYSWVSMYSNDEVYKDICINCDHSKKFIKILNLNNFPVYHIKYDKEYKILSVTNHRKIISESEWPDNAKYATLLEWYTV